MQKIEKVKLKNGLEVFFILDKRFTTSTAQMFFKIGWRHDTEKHLGIAHLFEHLVGKRTKKYSKKSEFTEELERMGIESNAYTAGDYTCYYHNQTYQNLFKSVEMLYEAIYNTNFDSEDLEKEKKIVMNEMREYEDSDDHLLWKETMKNLYPNTTLTKNIFGTNETMKNITLETFENFYQGYKNPKNSFLMIGTDDGKQKKKIIKFLEQKTPPAPLVTRGERVQFEKIVEKEGERKEESKIHKPDRKQSNLRVAYKLWDLNKKERVEFGILQQILTGGFSGKIFKRLRDELGLTYGISLGADSYAGFVYCAFGSMCEKNKKDILIAELKKEIKKLEISLAQKDIADVRELLLFREDRNHVANAEVTSFANSFALGKEYVDSKFYKKVLKEVKIVDLKKLMKKIFVEKNSTICVLE